MRLLFMVMIGAMVSQMAAAGSNNYGDQGLLPFPLINAAVLSGPAVTSSVVDTRTVSNIGLQINMGASATVPVGLILVDVSEDYSPSNVGKWTTLSFASQSATWSTVGTAATPGTPAAVFYNASPGAVFYREIQETSAPYMRVRWVPTVTAAGVFSVYMSGK